MHVPYIGLGECSGRADFQWVTFKNTCSVRVFASMCGVSLPMQMNARYYNTTKLESMNHNEKLVKEDNIEVHLYHKHMGLGWGVGDNDSWSHLCMTSIWFLQLKKLRRLLLYTMMMTSTTST